MRSSITRTTERSRPPRERNGGRGDRDFNAYLAGHFGVPVVLVTGDRAVTAEAKTLISDVHTVAAKDATSATAARNLHSKKAREQIRAKAAKALGDAKTIPPLVAMTPLEVVVEFKDTAAADFAAMIPSVRRVGGTRLEFEAKDYLEAFRTFYAIVTISSVD